MNTTSDTVGQLSLPTDILNAKAWLVWRLVQKPGQKKPSKMPYYASGAMRGWPFGKPDDDNPTEQQPHAPQGSELDRQHMVTYAQACAALSTGRYAGVGLATFSDLGVVALDFDACVREGEVDPRVLKWVEGTYAEISPSGTGVRAFFRGSLPSRKDTQPDNGGVSLEVFGNTGFVTVTGNVLPEHVMWGWDSLVAPLSTAVLQLYESRFGMIGMGLSSGDSMNALMNLSPKLGWTLDQARAYLFDCDAQCDRDHWLKTLAALHHEFDGSDDALKLADEWSATGGSSYAGLKDVQGRWNSFGRNQTSPITGRWLLKWRDECLTRKRYKLVDDWKLKIKETTDEFTLRERLCPQIVADANLGDMEREQLAQALMDAFKSLGSKYPIAQCRKLVTPKHSHKSHQQNDLPDWLKPWVYVTDEDKFYRMDSDEWLSMQSFNAKFNRMMPTDEDGNIIKNAAWTALEDYQIKSVTRGIYLPWAGETFDLYGVDCVNTYRPSSVPEAADSISASGQGAINLVIRHLNMLCGNRQDVVNNLLAWMAHNVQKPGVKIRWTPLVKGVEGDGKTLLGTIMSAVLGHPNVKQISPKVLGTDFSDWAHGACVGVLEEIKLTGHNRHDILNALKPFITNDQVAVHPKGSAEFNVINTMNYMAFTNHADALPLGETDRRWYIVFTPFTAKEDMWEAIRKLGEGDTGAYFDKLYGAIAAHVGDLRRWLVDYPIPATFKPNGSAPDTEEKHLMIAMSVSPDEDAVQEAIEEKGVGVTDTVLSSSCLTDVLRNTSPELNLQTTALNRMLVKLGWTKLPKKLKWRGKTHSAWTRGVATQNADELRAMLDKTYEQTVVGFESSESEVDLFN